MISWADESERSQSVKRHMNLRHKGRPFTEGGLYEGVDNYDDLLVLDEMDGMKLIHYANDEHFEHSLGLGRYRGVVFNENNKIVCNSHPFTNEYSVRSIDLLESDNLEVCRAYEGTILRLYYSPSREEKNGYYCLDLETDGCWYLSTYKKIDGTNSKWNAQPFSVYFKELFFENEVYERLNLLDKNICYTFLLCHNDNKMVVTHPSNRLYFVMRWNIEQQLFESVRNDKTFENFQHIFLPEFVDQSQQLQTLKTSNSSVGFLVTNFKGNKLGCTKYLYDEYIQDRDIRGNEPNLRMAYFGAVANNHKRDFERIVNDVDVLSTYDEEISQLIEFIYDAYTIRFINNEYIIFPKDLFVILRRIHDDHHDKYTYASDEERRELIEVVLWKYNPRVLNACVKHVKVLIENN